MLAADASAIRVQHVVAPLGRAPAVRRDGHLRIEATNSTTVLAIAGAGAFTLKFGSQSPGSTGSVGLAVGVNRVTSDVSAYSSGSTITSGGSVIVSAESSIEIEGYAYGGALSVSTGRSSSGSGLVWDGAGGGVVLTPDGLTVDANVEIGNGRVASRPISTPGKLTAAPAGTARR